MTDSINRISAKSFCDAAYFIERKFLFGKECCTNKVLETLRTLEEGPVTYLPSNRSESIFIQRVPSSPDVTKFMVSQILTDGSKVIEYIDIRSTEPDDTEYTYSVTGLLNAINNSSTNTLLILPSDVNSLVQRLNRKINVILPDTIELKMGREDLYFFYTTHIQNKLVEFWFKDKAGKMFDAGSWNIEFFDDVKKEKPMNKSTDADDAINYSSVKSFCDASYLIERKFHFNKHYCNGRVLRALATLNEGDVTRISVNPFKSISITRLGNAIPGVIKIMVGENITGESKDMVYIGICSLEPDDTEYTYSVTGLLNAINSSFPGSDSFLPSDVDELLQHLNRKINVNFTVNTIKLNKDGDDVYFIYSVDIQNKLVEFRFNEDVLWDAYGEGSWKIEYFNEPETVSDQDVEPPVIYHSSPKKEMSFIDKLKHCKDPIEAFDLLGANFTEDFDVHNEITHKGLTTIYNFNYNKADDTIVLDFRIKTPEKELCNVTLDINRENAERVYNTITGLISMFTSNL